MTEVPPDMVVLDEAHCLSQWGDNFRAQYRQIGGFCHQYNPKVIFACTATCTEEIERDICEVLGISPSCTLWQYYRRDNLTLSSRELLSEYDMLEEIDQVNGKTIVYFSTIKRLTTCATWLQEKRPDLRVGIYHGELSSPLKAHLQDGFKAGDVDVMCATNAFGLGVNVTDVRCVIHHDPPGTPEALAQEVGRAGRDDKPSKCISFHHAAGWRTQDGFVEQGNPSTVDIKKVYNTLKRLGGNGRVVQVTGKDLAQKAQVQAFGIYAILQILTGAGCIQEADVVDRVAKIGYIGNTEDSRFQTYKDLVIRGGQQLGSFYEVNLDWLRQQIGVEENTMMGWFRNWRDEGFLLFEPPFKGKSRIVTGDLSRVDFERLEYKRKRAWYKLDKTKEYMAVPNMEKHEFLEEYFARWSPDIATEA